MAPVNNEDVAAIFEEFADLLGVQGANPFRVRAYRNAARTVLGLSEELSTLVERGEDLTELPGIGAELSAKIVEILKTGTARSLAKLHREVPHALQDLLRLPGLGPKRVGILYRELGVKSLSGLEKAIRGGRVRDLPGFGARMEEQILDAIRLHRVLGRRHLLSEAADTGGKLKKFLERVTGVDEVVIAGSFRRGRETVGDLDILVTAAAGSPVMDRLVEYGEIDRLISRGRTRATVILRGGLQVDVRVVDAKSFGAALYYFTGSKAHNIRVRALGQKQGLKINEYGVFRGARRIAGRTEESVFKSIGLPYIAPELREDQGEIEAAREKRLPALVELRDIQGDLHVHTDASDGLASLERMVEAARRHGLHYLAVTDHSRGLGVARGLGPDAVLKQIEAIDALNEGLKGITVLKAIEVEILEDGRLDLPDRVLRRLDLVVGAAHSHLRLPRRKQTERLMRAMDHRCFSILAHPSGRLLLERQPCDVDMEQVIRHARQRGCFIEINSQPGRLDLADLYCRTAKAEGLLVCVNSDAHREQDFADLQYGVTQARRGWLEKTDVLNTRPLKDLRPLLKATIT